MVSTVPTDDSSSFLTAVILARGASATLRSIGSGAPPFNHAGLSLLYSHMSSFLNAYPWDFSLLNVVSNRVQDPPQHSNCHIRPQFFRTSEGLHLT